MPKCHVLAQSFLWAHILHRYQAERSPRKHGQRYKIMTFNNYTIKAQEIVQKAVQLCQGNKNQALEPVHLLKAVMTEGDAVVKFIFQKLDIAQAMIERPLEEELPACPRYPAENPT